jgi:hypothetical protein
VRVIVILAQTIIVRILIGRRQVNARGLVALQHDSVFVRDMKTSRTPSAPLRKDADPLNRAFKQFALLAWRIRFGWALVLVTGSALTAVSIGLLVAFPSLPELVHQAIITALVVAWMCLGLLAGMLRRILRGPTVAWDQLSRLGKLQRVMVTALGTAFLIAPIAWIAWLIMR